MVDYSKWDNLVVTSSDDDSDNLPVKQKKQVASTNDVSKKECEELEAAAMKIAKENEKKIAFYLRHGFQYFLMDERDSGKFLGGTAKLVEVVYKGGDQVGGLINGFKNSTDDSGYVLIGVRDSMELVNWFSVKLGEYSTGDAKEAAACKSRRCSHWPRNLGAIVPLEEFEEFGDRSANMFRLKSEAASSAVISAKKKKEKKSLNGANQPKKDGITSAPPERKIDESRKLLKVIIVPGNGCDLNVRSSNWYGELEKILKARKIDVALENMPDPMYAREKKWIPFIVNNLAGGEKNLQRCIVVGHSSGAVAAMRLAERYKVGGLILVAVYTSHLNNATEKRSGYFDRAWNWKAQKENAGFIVQFASKDDPFLPIEEQKMVKNALKGACEYIELDKKSHFFEMCPELKKCIIRKAKNFYLKKEVVESAVSAVEEIKSGNCNAETKTCEINQERKSRPEFVAEKVVTVADESVQFKFDAPGLLKRRRVIQGHNVDVVLQVFSNKLVVNISEDGRACNSVVRTKSEVANEVGTKLWTKTKALMGKSSELVDLLARLLTEHLYKQSGKQTSILLRSGFSVLDVKAADEVFDLIRSLLTS